jgi:hypothetical protein
MIKLFKKKAEILFYDSIEEMPHRNYMKFNKEMMRDREVGSSISDIMKRISRAMQFIAAQENDKAMKELTNAQMAYAYSQNEIDPKGLALAAMVKSINGVESDNITADGLKNTLEVLQRLGLTKAEVDDTAGKIKKK